MGYEDVFGIILIKKRLPIFKYGLDCIVLDSLFFDVVSQRIMRFNGYIIIGNMTQHVCCPMIIILSMRYFLDLKLLCFICELCHVQACY